MSDAVWQFRDIDMTIDDGRDKNEKCI